MAEEQLQGSFTLLYRVGLCFDEAQLLFSASLCARRPLFRSSSRLPGADRSARSRPCAGDRLRR